jgi:hypothetical protein
MNNETLQQILDQTGIEAKLDNVARSFDEHIRDDALLAADVHRLAKRQRGYITTGVVTIGAGVAAGASYIAAKFFGVKL